MFVFCDDLRLGWLVRFFVGHYSTSSLGFGATVHTYSGVLSFFPRVFLEALVGLLLLTWLKVFDGNKLESGLLLSMWTEWKMSGRYFIRARTWSFIWTRQMAAIRVFDDNRARKRSLTI